MTYNTMTKWKGTKRKRLWIYQRGNRIRKSKDRQHNDEKKKDPKKKKTNKQTKQNKLRSTKHYTVTKDRVTRTKLKSGVNSVAPEG